MIVTKKAAIFLFLFWLGVSHGAEPKTEIVPIQHRQAAELVDTLQPFLEEGGIIRAYNHQLIIKSSDQNLTELKQIIQKLDQAPRQLLITVRQPLASEAHSYGSSTSGQITPKGSSVSIKTYSTSSRDQAPTEQQIRTLEGQPAAIYIGQAFPLGQQETVQTPSGSYSKSRVDYKEVKTGFTVIPRVNGDEVILEISPQTESLPVTGGGMIQIQRAHTTVRGKLGEWLELSGATSEQNSTGKRLLYSTRSRDKQTRRILVKVNEIK